MTSAHVWLTPPLGGALESTGGTRYARHLLEALGRAHRSCERIDLEDVETALAPPHTGVLWVDSLYLDRVPALVQRAAGRFFIVLVLHYLPTLVERGCVTVLGDLDDVERSALASADAVVASSAWLGDSISRLTAVHGPVRVLEPGVELYGRAPPSPTLPASQRPIRAVLIGAVVPGKGVLPFLQALGPCLQADDPFDLTVVGGLDFDSAYAAACVSYVETHPELASRVHFTGVEPHSRVIERLAEADFLISASRMESFGMALSEARALGIPIVARRGGNAENLVRPISGGLTVDDDDELARASVALVRDRGWLVKQTASARRALYERSWDDVAEDFVRLAGEFGSMRPSAPV